MQPPKTKPPRPLGVTALSVLVILIGVFGIAGGAALVVEATTILASLDALLAVAIGILYVTSGIGFFPGKSWAWTTAIGVSMISLAVSVIEHPAAHAYGIPGAIAAIVVIYYLTRNHVKSFFRTSSK
jgi:hypothetical protein